MGNREKLKVEKGVNRKQVKGLTHVGRQPQNNITQDVTGENYGKNIQVELPVTGYFKLPERESEIS